MKNEVLLNLVSSTKLVRNLSYYLDRVQAEPIFICRNSEIVAVLVSLEKYRKLIGGDEK